jgi:hypothetical protein
VAKGNEAGLLFPVIKKSGGGSASKRQGSGKREQGLEEQWSGARGQGSVQDGSLTAGPGGVPFAVFKR